MAMPYLRLDTILLDGTYKGRPGIMDLAHCVRLEKGAHGRAQLKTRDGLTFLANKQFEHVLALMRAHGWPRHLTVETNGEDF